MYIEFAPYFLPFISIGNIILLTFHDKMFMIGTKT